ILGGSRTPPPHNPAPPPRSSSLWLQAHDDPMAGLRSFPGCMGEGRLGEGQWGGGRGGLGSDPSPPPIIPPLTLPDPPAGVGALGGPGGAPALGVAAGGALYVYRNLRPFYKFRVPPRDPHPLERDLWVQAAQVTGGGGTHGC
uniref:Uncharacterized protein n=1 Tax=Melopsittacus undulatus TaxID=13146 RepID=A0A8V5GZF2_MELUD